ncbi:MAG: hypothetical protein ACOCRK_00415 [bacterium]
MEITTEQWKELTYIMEQFGYKVVSQDNNLQNQNFVWEIIINIKKNILEEVKQAIRVNLQLCYLIDEEEKVKTINEPLYKISHIFDQNIYRLDNETAKGLNNFHKLITSTFGNMVNFINNFKKVKENLYFIRKRYDQLIIEKYNYLKKITLPLKGYEELRIALLTILKKYTKLKIIISDPNEYNKFIDEINIFIKRYISTYKKEHNEFHKKLDNFYKDLYSLPEYNALDKLSKIDVINVAYNMRPIKKYINTFFPEKCSIKNIDKVLQKQVRCSCGFNIGQTLTIPSLNKIKPMLMKGIIEYIEQLQHNRFKPLFENYLNYNNNSQIPEVLTIKPNQLKNNLDKINSNLIKEINKALSNTYPLKIKFNELANSVTGTYPVTQIEILGQEIQKKIKDLINKKLDGLENINYNEIMINLVE